MGFSAYLIWGTLPLYFQLVARSGAYEIVAYRIVYSLLFCLLVIVITREWQRFVKVLRSPRTVLVLLGLGALITLNWTLYVWGVNNGHAIDASLGYFMNPLVNAAFGVLLLGERMRPLQWVAFGIGGIAVTVLIVGYGQVPWVAFGLALSFGVYGLVKKKLGRGVPPLAGLAVETAATTPFALIYLGWLAATGMATATLPSGYGMLMMIAGPLTAIPLLLFAAAAHRIPLSTLGILQYIAPIMQFLLGWLFIGEQMPTARWIGFIIIWVAVLIFLLDALRVARYARLSQLLTKLEAG